MKEDFGAKIREKLDRRELETFGKLMDLRSGLGLELGEALPEEIARLQGRSVGEFLAEALLKVRGKDGRLHPLKANAVQREYERRRGTRNIVLKARQMGMTTWVAGRLLLKTITRPGTLTLQVAHTQESAEEILGIVHRFVEHLPPGLRVGVLRTSKSNVRQVVFPQIDSQYRVESAADRNAGRGLTVQNLHCSEVSRWGSSGSGGGAVSAAETLAGLRACLAPGGELVLESTPNGAYGCFYQEWQKADATRMVRHFFPWWLERGYRSAAVDETTLTEEEKELMTRPASGPGGAGLSAIGLDLEQIGFRRAMLREQGALAVQEFAEDAERCFLVSGSPFFEMHSVEARLKTARRPWERRQNGDLEIWLPPAGGNNYVVSVDTAGGGAGGDLSAIQVLDIETGLQCAEFAAPITGIELARAAANLAWEYNKATVVVERNNHGSGVIWLLQQQVGYPRVYHASDGQAGWLTTSVSRPQMLARMAAAIMDSPEIFQSRKLLAECRSFVRMANGHVGAASGTHDDRVMAMAIGLAARAELLGAKATTLGAA